MKQTILNLKWLSLAIIILLCSLMLEAQVQYPDNVDTAECTVTPPANKFDIALKWETKKNSDPQTYINGVSTPLVADLNGDGQPEVIGMWGNTEPGSNYPRHGGYVTCNLIILDGKTGRYKYTIQTHDYQNMGQTIAIADVNKDGKCEIFIVSIGDKVGQGVYKDRYVYCYDGSKKNSGPDDYLWKSDEPLDAMYTPLVADVNNDGIANLVCGGTVFNAINGKRLINGTLVDGGTGFGDPHCVNGSWNISKSGTLGEGYHLCALADIDGDKKLELCAGNTVYKFTLQNPIGTNGNKFEVLRQCEKVLPYTDCYNGQTIVLDFDNDGDLDICVIAGRTDHFASSIFSTGQNHLGLYVWDGQSSEMIGYFMCDPKTFSLSVPFAADINGDGLAEVLANGWICGYHWLQSEKYMDMMHVWRYKKGASTSSPTKSMNIEEIFTRAEATAYSESAGFTVFDFNQDGKAEIVYRGRNKLYILDGTTLEQLCDPIDALSGTLGEYPIVADVDCDGHADILFTDQFESTAVAGSMHVYESASPGAWGPARKVWNQWPYNVVNINEDMTVPQFQFNVATKFPNNRKPFNAFLQQATMLNREGDMFVAAADAEIIHDDKTFQNLCNEFVINLTYTNRGSLMLTAPYSVSVYQNSLRGQVIRTVQKNTNLMVGDTTTIVMRFSENDINRIGPISRFVVAVNDAGSGIAQNGLQQQECNLKNNVDSCDFSGLRTSEEFDNPITICEGEVYTVGEHDYTTSGNYIDTLKNQYGCDSIVKTHLTVSSIHFDFATTKYCSDELPVTLDASSCNAANYNWNTGATTPSIQATINDGGSNDTWEYFVIVSNGDGCSDTSNTVTVYRNPEVTITPSIDTANFCSAGEAILTAAANNINQQSELTWFWNSGETSASITVETTHEKTFSAEATFNGCKGTARFDIAECPCRVELFNTFTPNGDGINDTFAPKLEATFKSYQFIIYDRWGKSVYKSEDPSESWDGTINGQAAADGVYYYVFTYACMSAPLDLVSKHGSITLVR